MDISAPPWFHPGNEPMLRYFFAAGGVGADCGERALAAGVEGGVQETERG
jgi:hypothetical protein